MKEAAVTLKKLVINVNRTLIWYKKNGWIDCCRTPSSGQEIIAEMSDFLDARLNREAWNIPEFREAEELLGGHLFKFESITGIDEVRKKYKQAVFTLTTPEKVIEPDENLINVLKSVEKFIGGTTIKFNGVKVKVKVIIEN